MINDIERDWDGIFWVSVYSAADGGMVWERKHDIDADDPYSFPGYCGTCKSLPCLVEAGHVCCHDMVRYARCTHVQQEGRY